MGIWTPPVGASERPGPASGATENLRTSILYLRSFLLMRTLIGVMGVLLPAALLVGDGLGTPRGSLSAYYHSGMRDVFVSSLCVTAFFLMFYKAFERNLENTLTIVAGVAALGVALFPTGQDSRTPGQDGGTPEQGDGGTPEQGDGGTPGQGDGGAPGQGDGGAPGQDGETLGVVLGPLQAALGEGLVETVHYGCAAAFILSLGVVSYLFGRREGARSRRRDGRVARFSPAFWRTYHYVCAGGIAVAVAYMLITVGGSHSLIIGETAAVLCFGASWLAKGLEMDVLASSRAAAKHIEAGTAAT